ncbi:MAG: ABC transporter ATP-binding protein [Candidatus Aminicenantes bacterium]|nr:ABC transporter ATP-binding protein [Candidatus Aminicenantes bacterium]
MSHNGFQNGTAIVIENLSFSYDKGKPVLRGLSLIVERGERLGIIGPSGAGKSTLLLHLNGLLMGEGHVEVLGQAVGKKTIPEIRSKVGLVFQNPDDQLFNPTVKEDVAFGPLNMGLPEEEVHRRVEDSLKAMNLKGFEQKAAHHLSFGERKRVALATVLSMQPEVVAFDEPFSNLDPHMVRQVVEIIKGIPGTVIVVSQAILPLVSCCDRLALLKGGRIEACGSTMDIIRDKALISASGMDFDFYCDICRRIHRNIS